MEGTQERPLDSSDDPQTVFYLGNSGDVTKRVVTTESMRAWGSDSTRVVGNCGTVRRYLGAGRVGVDVFVAWTERPGTALTGQFLFILDHGALVVRNGRTDEMVIIYGPGHWSSLEGQAVSLLE